jgi:hypothetical protein
MLVGDLPSTVTDEANSREWASVALQYVIMDLPPSPNAVQQTELMATQPL